MLSSSEMRHEHALRRVAIDFRRRLLIASGDQSTSLWRLPGHGTVARAAFRTGTSPTPVRGEGRRYSTGWSLTSGLLATAGADGEIRLWRLPIGGLTGSHASTVVPETLYSDGQRVVDVEYDHLRLSAIDGSAATGWIVLPQPPTFAELLDSGRVLLVVTGRELRRYDATDLSLLHAPVELPAAPQRLLTDPAGTLGVLTFGGSDAGGFRERVEVLDLATGGRRLATTILDGPLQLELAPDQNRLLATGPRSTATSVLDLPSLRLVGTYEHDPDTFVAWARFQPSTEVVLIVERAVDPVMADDALVEWDPESDRVVRRRALPGAGVVGVLATGSGPFVAGARFSAFDPDGPFERRLPSQARAPTTAVLALSADGKVLARALRFDDVEIYDVATRAQIGEPLHTTATGVDLMAQLAFSPDGGRLLGRTTRGAWVSWPVAAESRPVAELKRALAALSSPSADQTAADAPTPVERKTLRSRDPGPWPAISARPAPVALRYVGEHAIPPRSAAATRWMLDLTQVYNIAPKSELHPRVNMIATMYHLPWGVQRIGSTDYDIRGAVQLISTSTEETAGNVPREVRGIPVPADRIAAFRVLLFAGHRSTEPEERTYAQLRLHYRDGTEAVAPIRTQRDVPGWTERDLPVPRAWEYGFYLRLIGVSSQIPVHDPRLPNPHPERPIESIDLESGDETWNSPVFLAVTAEPVIETAASCTGCQR